MVFQMDNPPKKVRAGPKDFSRCDKWLKANFSTVLTYYLMIMYHLIDK
jgi:hypothetical protein